jgi:hypothetical protein
MRIDDPNWITVDHATHESVRVEVPLLFEQRLPGLSRTTSVCALGRHPAMLQKLERVMAPRPDAETWAARLWAAAPFPRFDARGALVFGWIETYPDESIEHLFTSWKHRVARPISALLLTWTCFQVPLVDQLVDLRAADAHINHRISMTTAQIMGQVMPVRRYRRGDEPPIQGAYDHATRTLFRVV